MAVYSFTDLVLYHHDFELQTYASSMSLEVSRADLDDTTFGDTYRSRTGGLYDAQLSIDGFLDDAASGDPDDLLFAEVGTSRLTSICPQDAENEDLCFFGEFAEFAYQQGAQIGELHAFTVNASGTNKYGPIRGQVLAKKRTASSSGNNQGYEISAVSSSQRVYAGLHVFSGSGTLDVDVQSDSSALMPSPTTRISFTQATGPTSEFASLAGPLSDDAWRASWTVGSGTWSFVVLIGIA